MLDKLKRLLSLIVPFPIFKGYGVTSCDHCFREEDVMGSSVEDTFCVSKDCITVKLAGISESHAGDKYFRIECIQNGEMITLNENWFNRLFKIESKEDSECRHSI